MPLDPLEVNDALADYSAASSAASLAELRKQNANVAPCPWCGGPIPAYNVEVCMHCRKELFWDNGFVAKTVAAAKAQNDTAQKNALSEKIRAERLAAERKVRVKEGLSEYSSGMILGGILWAAGFLVGMPGLWMAESGGWFLGFIGVIWCLVTYGVGVIGLGILLWNLGCLMVKAWLG